MPLPNSRPLNVGFWNLPDPRTLDPLSVGTLVESQCLQLLTSGPLWSYGTHFESIHASVETPDPADFARWRVTFFEKAKLSNGQLLLAENWLWSLIRVLAEGKGVHFNPKRDFLEGDRLAATLSDHETDLQSILEA